MKTSQAAAENSPVKIATGNESWGFHYTLQENLKLSDAEAADAFDRAARFTAKRLGMDTDAARRLLDSKLGRHLADACVSTARIEETLDSLYGSWKRDVREFRRMAINSTDEAFYS